MGLPAKKPLTAKFAKKSREEREKIVRALLIVVTKS
jgi:hypothetical protein